MTLLADKYGTAIEQQRHGVAWRSPAERAFLGHEIGHRCGTCRHRGARLARLHKCNRHGFATMANAICREFERLAS